MKYISTRGKSEPVSDIQAIFQGLADDGGLFVPETIPMIDSDFFESLKDLDYPKRVAKVMHLYLEENFTLNELETFASEAYSTLNFPNGPYKLFPINPYDYSIQMLELWHGPTAAFKDMALQILPKLLRASADKLGREERILILTATSGDTGKAALEGFKDLEGCDICVFYPSEGVSDIQKKSMQIQTGSNVHVYGIKGDFDDAQSAVKRVFADEKLQTLAKENKVIFSSANSINWGRLLPQIVYYVSSYVDLLKDGKFPEDQPVSYDVIVPSGNFGNILAAWYAKQMGVPIRRFIVASNKNKVLADFLSSGKYDRRRKLYQTTSPSMDILVSSNLERLLFEISEHDADLVRNCMEKLNKSGAYTISRSLLRFIRDEFSGAYASDDAASDMILEVYDRFDQPIDPHTAVAYTVFSRLQRKVYSIYPTLIVSTASPYKFTDCVYNALFQTDEAYKLDEVTRREAIEKETGLEIPSFFTDMDTLPILHDEVIDTEDMSKIIEKIVKK